MATCLIVDDDPRFRGLARLLLDDEGFTVVGEAEDCASALAAARELRPDVVLLDVHLVNASGFDVAARLTADCPSAAVLMTSTYDGPDFESLARRNGARGFVPKDALAPGAIRAALA